MSRKNKVFPFLVIFIFLLVILLAVYFIRGKLFGVEGTYLVEGVAALFKIEQSPKGYRIREIPERYKFLEQARLDFHRDRLFILFRKPRDGDRTPLFHAWDLKRSETLPGDWDLLSVSRNWALSEDAATSGMVLLEPLIKSLFHLVHDANVAQYFQSLSSKSPHEKGILKLTYENILRNTGMMKEKSGMALAEELLSSHPGDDYIRMLYLDALLRLNSYTSRYNETCAEFKRRLEEWEKTRRIDPHSSIRFSFDLAKQVVKAHFLSREGNNAFSFMDSLQMRDNPSDFEMYVEKIISCEGFMYPRLSLSPVDTGYPNIFLPEMASKFLLQESIFAMMRGDPKRASDLIAMVYQLSWILTEAPPGNEWVDYCGREMEKYVCDALEVYLLNSCDSPGEIEEWIGFLNEWQISLSEPRARYMFSQESSPFLFLMRKTWPWMEEYVFRTDLNVRLLSVAAAARLHFLRKGKFPESIADFPPHLPRGLPKDPYNNSPLRFLPGESSCMIYSIGPDGVDDEGLTLYDPTNGVGSRGDIAMEVSRKRKYPFPPRGKLAQSREDLLKQFPNGLPPDFFYPNENAPLSIVDTIPARIISLGPDRDSNTGAGDTNFISQPPYDPTNGLTSAGNLILDTAATPNGIHIDRRGGE